MRDYNYAEWKIWAWRTVRGAFWSGVVIAYMVPMDWTKQEQTLKAVGAAFVAGFGQALFRKLREKADEEAGSDATVTKVVTKMPL